MTYCAGHSEEIINEIIETKSQLIQFIFILNIILSVQWYLKVYKYADFHIPYRHNTNRLIRVFISVSVRFNSTFMGFILKSVLLLAWNCTCSLQLVMNFAMF